MKLLLTTSLLFLFAGTDQKVYICDNGKTNVYHVNRLCPRLEKCKYKTATMSMSSAKSQGMTKCKDKSE